MTKVMYSLFMSAHKDMPNLLFQYNCQKKVNFMFLETIVFWGFFFTLYYLFIISFNC